MREVKKPELDGSTLNHDAYGIVTLSMSKGGAPTLFGSDIKHNQRIVVSVTRAKLDRKLSDDWAFGTDRLIEFEMSHSQFAQFITSGGNGGGTQVTLRYAPERGYRIQAMPEIENIETKADTFRREINESATMQINELSKKIDQLEAMIESGKVSKKELRDLCFNMKMNVENMPANMEFVVKQAEKALEKATSNAKIEVESYIDNARRRLGDDAMEKLAAIEDKQPIYGNMEPQ